MRLFSFIIGIAILCVLPGAALAQTTTFNISGTFTAPATGSYSGSYVVNTGTNSIVSANIQVTAGKAADGTTDLPAATFNFPGAENPTVFAVASATPAAGNPGVFVTIGGGKSTPSGVSQVSQGICVGATCAGLGGNGSNTRAGTGTVTAAVVPVPTLSEWAMILLGTILAGGAALYLQRRRSIA